MFSIFQALLEEVGGRMPAVLLRWFYTEERLIKGVRFDIRTRHSPVTIWGKDVASVHIWVTISNRLPFFLELDRALLRFVLGPAQVKIFGFERVEIPRKKDKDILLSGTFNPQTETLLNSARNKDAMIDGIIQFNSRVRNFTLPVTLTGINKSNFKNFD